MESFARLKKNAIDKLNALPKDQLLEVVDFIDFITNRRRGVAPGQLPPTEAFLECAGTWKFEPGEAEDLLQDIEKSRLMEVEEQSGGVLA